MIDFDSAVAYRGACATAAIVLWYFLAGGVIRLLRWRCPGTFVFYYVLTKSPEAHVHREDWATVYWLFSPVLVGVFLAIHLVVMLLHAVSCGVVPPPGRLLKSWLWAGDPAKPDYRVPCVWD